LRQANSLGTNYAIIIGETEVRTQSAILRDMMNNEQKIVPLSEIAAALN
ncbi:unnamed protein product, partial [marine sediment metagenome]